MTDSRFTTPTVMIIREMAACWGQRHFDDAPPSLWPPIIGDASSDTHPGQARTERRGTPFGALSRRLLAPTHKPPCSKRAHADRRFRGASWTDGGGADAFPE